MTATKNDLLTGTALIAAVIEASKAADKAADAKAAAKTSGESASATLQRLAVMAVISNETVAVKEAVKGREDWKKAKGSWSGAENMAAWIKAGNKLPADKTPWVIGGNPVSVVDRSTLTLLATERTGDAETSVSSLIKRWRVVVAEREKNAEAVEGKTRDVIAAYLATDEGAAKYPNEDAETIRVTLMADPSELARIIKAGAEAQEEAARLAAEAQHVADLTEAAEALTDELASLPPDVFARLAEAVLAQMDEAALESLTAARRALAA